MSNTIYANETDLKTATVRTYPILRGFERAFEYGFNLKLYPDDPVEVAVKGKETEAGLSNRNRILILLSQVDVSSSKPSSN